MSERSVRRTQSIPLQSSASLRVLTGIVLVGVFWTIAWLQLRPVSDHYFFPLWLGYILTVDGLIGLRTGTSPIERGGWRIAWWFAVSVPVWWIFEAFNRLVDNWTYHQPTHYSGLEYVLLSSIAFSTVVPAVLTTTELVRSFRLDPLRWLPRFEPGPSLLVLFHLFGWLMFALTALWPKYAFPLVWLSLIFLLDPIATALGLRSLAWHTARRDWSPHVNIGLATLACGWFWELWNLYALPKWTYSIPHAGFLPVFEMPLLGFGGYIPFGFEIYVLYVLARRLTPALRMEPARVSSHVD
ncbi:MAG: hypothetical protein ACRD1H_01400 [Vicinamibacterales bacterium]